jgi:rSAM/selenodomain-associated transferase 1
VGAAETAAARATVVAVLTRAPRSGGKSRLFAALGAVPDPLLSTALLLDTLDAVASHAWTRVVAVEPSSACDDVRALVPDDVRVMPQRQGDLGERMRGAMDDLFAAGAGAVAIIGSDLPEIDARAIGDAFDLLTREPRAVVLGPAHDGGYYLVAATHTPDLFSGIEWGSARVLEMTLAAARAGGLQVHCVGPAADVDTVDDVRRIARTGTDAPSSRVAWRTRAWLRASGMMDHLKE